MNAVQHQAPPVSRADWLQLGHTWFLAAVIAAPLGIVLHEAAHFLAAVAFGFEGASLHFASTDYAGREAFWQAYFNGSAEAARRILPVWQVGVVAIAGVAFNWLLAVAAALLAPGRDLRSFGGALLGAFALFAPVRASIGLTQLLTVRPRYLDTLPAFDEFRAATALGLPVELLVAVGVGVAIFCWYYLLPKLGRDLFAVAPMLIMGSLTGIFVWMAIGLLILP